MANNETRMAPGKVEAELSYLEFHKQKSSLANGTYRVVEHDGEINYAVLGDCRGLLWFDLDWYTEDEYISYHETDAQLNAIMDFDPDLDEELMDSWDIAMHRAPDASFDDAQFGQLITDQVKQVPVFQIDIATEPKTLGEILREYQGTDVRQMSEGQYAEHCESVEQDRRDGVNL